MGVIRQRWTSEEEAALRAGIASHGVGKWRTILKDPEFSSTLSHRSNIDLKDKWRNMDELVSPTSSNMLEGAHSCSHYTDQRRFGLRMGAWTSEEEATLRAGIARHGVGKWRTILKDPEFTSTLSCRSNIDLKDKWRNMDKIVSTTSSRDKAKTGVKRARTTPKNNEQIDDEIVDAKPIASLHSEAKNTSNSKKSHSRLRSSSIQLEALSIEHAPHIEQPVKAEGNKKVSHYTDQRRFSLRITDQRKFSLRMGVIKQRWTSEEEAALRAGIARHGVGKWRTILKDPEFSSTLSHRSNIDLKDKWRNMDELVSPTSSCDKAKTGVKRARTTPKNNEQIDDLIVDEKPIASLPSEAKNTSNSKKSHSRLRSSSIQLEALSIEHPPHIEQPVKAEGNKKVKLTKKKQGLRGKNVRTTNVPLDSPSMGTRSKKTQPPSLAMSTRSKRRLSL